MNLSLFLSNYKKFATEDLVADNLITMFNWNRFGGK